MQRPLLLNLLNAFSSDNYRNFMAESLTKAQARVANPRHRETYCIRGSKCCKSVFFYQNTLNDETNCCYIDNCSSDIM